ncbi:cardiolipin synthase [Schleiferilactobacillus perolens]|uniref:cardiolipin synthase n=1 Tax=Schleiferilactobacillus perolens TaxID=100468 RepID=UPI00070D4661|nr:cardiolipin synthase [Schleiferilactobacillus perolens]MCI1891866.1 cardiolipin synthase [Schleiferilactobacillus harbinensis]MCI1911629.1 cardiolipin synthase [Schleiferilactobacillus harbinensis]MCI2170340.1 cardiolipin synthase [Schleiferilactobacillus perolens]
MGIVLNILIILFIFNTVGAVVTVFHRPRNIASTLAWLLVLVLLPVLGFILYAFLGRGLAQEKIFDISHGEHIGLQHLKRMILTDDKTDPDNERSDHTTTHTARQLIRYFVNAEDAPLTKRNSVKIYTDGQDQIQAIFADIKAAKETVHVEYYAFFNDNIGNQFLSLLTEKAREGLEVRLIYDPWGSPHTSNRWFKPFRDAGGHVVPFITAQNVVAKTRLNYHLHRKIVVIDGKIGYTGGFNVGDQYVMPTPKFGYWRDTQIRLVGTAVLSLQERFVMDWNASVGKNEELITFQPKYFRHPDPDLGGHANIQTVSDGPDTTAQILKGGMMRMIMLAEKSVWIQTPYLIPDDSMIDTLMIAAASGVDVRIMIPDRPDHPFIYRATQYYANLLTMTGIKIYIYNKGFIHAKTAVMDNKVVTVGSMNQDIRSYALNFEANCFIYDSKVSQEFTDIFNADIADSTLLTKEIIAQQSRWLRFKQYFSRLLSPIL